MKKNLLLITIAALSYGLVAYTGYVFGVAETTEKNLTDEIESLNQSLEGLNEQAQKAGELNLQLSQTINARKKADAESTKVFTNALAADAHLRFNCVFNDNIMQQLSEAADRADQAASGGFVSPLRSGDPPIQ